MAHTIKAMSQTELRLYAIALVIAYRPVLTDKEYIDAMYKATRLSYGPSGEDNIFKLLFGSDHKSYEDKYGFYVLEREILMLAGIPSHIKVSFIDEMNKRKGNPDYDSSVARAEWDLLLKDLASYQTAESAEKSGKPKN